jgi:hypothetical protein
VLAAWPSSCRYACSVDDGRQTTVAVCAAYLVQDELTERGPLFASASSGSHSHSTAAVTRVAQGSKATEHPSISRPPPARCSTTPQPMPVDVRLCLTIESLPALLSCYGPCLETICRIKSSRASARHGQVARFIS